MRAHDEVELLLRADGGLVVRRDHPHLVGSFDWLIHQGKLVTVLPGVYADPEFARTWQARARAVALRHPDAVLLGAAAARISFWPAAPIDAVEAAVRCVLKPQHGFSFSRRRIPDELIAVWDGLPPRGRKDCPARRMVCLHDHPPVLPDARFPLDRQGWRRCEARSARLLPRRLLAIQQQGRRSRPGRGLPPDAVHVHERLDAHRVYFRQVDRAAANEHGGITSPWLRGSPRCAGRSISPTTR